MSALDDIVNLSQGVTAEKARAELAALRARCERAEAELKAAHVYLDESPVNNDDDPPLELADRIAGVVNQLTKCRAQLATYQRKEAMRQ